MRESFVFYRSFFEAIKNLDDKKRLKMYDLILNFALNDEEIETKYEICSQLFTLIKPQLSANNKRYEDGKKGGRPKKIKTGGFSEKKPNVNENVNENVNDLSNCFLSPLDESAHEKNATERRNKKEVTDDKAEQNKGLQGITPIRTQKVDPYYSEEVKRFKSCYKQHFGAIPFLSSPQCLQLSELIEQTPDFFETLDDVLKTLKSIGEFTGKDGKKYKPSVSFLLKDKNYSDLRNGVYDNRAAPDEDFYNTTFMAALREVREQE